MFFKKKKKNKNKVNVKRKPSEVKKLVEKNKARMLKAGK